MGGGYRESVEKAESAAFGGLLAKTVASLGVGLTLVSLGAISAHAATPSSRFATYVDGAAGTVNLPAGYPSATITVTQDEVNTVSQDNLSNSPFKEFFTKDAAPTTSSPHLSLKGGQTGSQTIPNVITITFAEEVPGEHLGINFGDVDVETVVISMTGGTSTEPTTLTPQEMGFQGVYNSFTGSTTVDVPGTTQDSDANTFTLVAPGSTNTDGSSAWFLPSVGVREITLSSTFTVFGRFYVWFAAIRPEATLDALSSTFTLGDPPLTEPFAALSFPQGIIDTDFADADKTISYAVTNAGDTGCTLSGTPLSFTATTPGTCTLTASVPSSPDFVGTSETFDIAVSEPAPPAPAPPTTTSKAPRTTTAETPLTQFSGPELAPTGAPAWPMWPMVAALGGAALIALSRALRPHRNQTNSS